MNTALKYGLFAGAATVVYFLIFYLISPRMMLSAWVVWGSLIIYIGLMALAVARERQATAGSLPFREALRVAFTVFVAANAVYYTFYYLMFAVFDPALTDLQYQLFLENTGKYAGLLGQENAGEIERRARPDDFRVTLSKTALSYAWGLLGGFLLSLAVAGVVNRRR